MQQQGPGRSQISTVRALELPALLRFSTATDTHKENIAHTALDPPIVVRVVLKLGSHFELGLQTPSTSI